MIALVTMLPFLYTEVATFIEYGRSWLNLQNVIDALTYINQARSCRTPTILLEIFFPAAIFRCCRLLQYTCMAAGASSQHACREAAQPTTDHAVLIAAGEKVVPSACG